MTPRMAEAAKRLAKSELDAAGYAGLSFKQISASIRARYSSVSQRNVQDLIHSLERAEEIKGAGVRDNARCYVSSQFVPDHKREQTDRDAIYAWRDLTTSVVGPKPGRFDVR